MKKTKNLKRMMLFYKRQRKLLKRRKRNNSRKNPINDKPGYKKSVRLYAKEVFSLTENFKDTAGLLNESWDCLKNNRPVVFDLSKINHITIDSLVYLLAIINKARKEKKKASVSGNLPKNHEARDTILQSGFLKYVKSSISCNAGIDSCFQILEGKNSDPECAKKLCLYTQEKLGVTKIDTKGIYEIIMEIITNTAHHAYDNYSPMPHWYAYAKYIAERKSIDYTILDTGHGIPKTITKKITDTLFGSDEDLLLSVMNGDFRTSTKEQNRGKGIPRIVEYAKNQYISELKIISNKGMAEYTNMCQGVTINGSVSGTIYKWMYSG